MSAVSQGPVIKSNQERTLKDLRSTALYTSVLLPGPAPAHESPQLLGPELVDYHRQAHLLGPSLIRPCPNKEITKYRRCGPSKRNSLASSQDFSVIFFFMHSRYMYVLMSIIMFHHVSPVFTFVPDSPFCSRGTWHLRIYPAPVPSYRASTGCI